MSDDKTTDIETEETSETVNEASIEEATNNAETTESSEGPTAGVEVPTEEAKTEEPDGAPLEPVTLSGEEYKALQDGLLKAQENWDRLLRMTAEFDNFKKRAARERTEAIRYANEALLESLIPTLDNFEMALMATDNVTVESIDSLKQGITMVHKQLKDVIRDSGMEEVDAANQTFDPAWHEAVSQQETDEVPEGQVLQQLRKGYKLKDRLVRPANVVVAKAPSDASAAEEAATDQEPSAAKATDE